jgi:hypothetical protein
VIPLGLSTLGFGAYEAARRSLERAELATMSDDHVTQPPQDA